MSRKPKTQKGGTSAKVLPPLPETRAAKALKREGMLQTTIYLHDSLRSRILRYEANHGALSRQRNALICDMIDKFLTAEGY